jgi:cell division protein FtsW (lipid II flippase)
MNHFLARTGVEIGVIGLAITLASGVALVISGYRSSAYVSDTYASTMLIGLAVFILGLATFILGGIA